MTQDVAETEANANILVTVQKADITTLKVDAIASVIRPTLDIHGSLNSAIFAKAGHQLDDFILDNILKPKEGDVFSTPGFGLPAKEIIFAVLPAWRSDLDIIDKHLLTAIRGIIETACQSGVTSLAIPMICCGRKGYPKDRGIRLILQGVSERLKAPLMSLYFICYDDEAVKLYRQRLDI